MRFDSDNSEMFGQRQHYPIAKVTIEGHQRSFLLHGPFENQRVVSPSLTGFGRANDIVPSVPQKQRQFDPEHLIEVNSHDGLHGTERGDFRM